MPMLQHFDYNGVDVEFYDFDEDIHSVPAQPRCIHIIGPDSFANDAALNRDVRGEIAVEIRLGQGFLSSRDEPGRYKGMKY